ncbi:UNVERIFIED_CONTAM: hypothetical protein RKD50_009361 [Streptomyces canus]
MRATRHVQHPLRGYGRDGGLTPAVGTHGWPAGHTDALRPCSGYRRGQSWSVLDAVAVRGSGEPAGLESGEVPPGSVRRLLDAPPARLARRALGGCRPPRGAPLALAGGHGRAAAHVRAQREASRQQTALEGSPVVSWASLLPVPAPDRHGRGTLPPRRPGDDGRCLPSPTWASAPRSSATSCGSHRSSTRRSRSQRRSAGSRLPRPRAPWRTAPRGRPTGSLLPRSAATPTSARPAASFAG